MLKMNLTQIILKIPKPLCSENYATDFSILDIFMYTVGAATTTYGAAIYEPEDPLPF